jgi:hypothetical protein
MSLGSDDIAEARAARLEREAIERESYNDARAALGQFGFNSPAITDLLFTAKRTGGAVKRNVGGYVSVSYLDGSYTVR